MEPQRSVLDTEGLSHQAAVAAPEPFLHDRDRQQWQQ